MKFSDFKRFKRDKTGLSQQQVINAIPVMTMRFFNFQFVVFNLLSWQGLPLNSHIQLKPTHLKDPLGSPEGYFLSRRNNKTSGPRSLFQLNIPHATCQWWSVHMVPHILVSLSRHCYINLLLCYTASSYLNHLEGPPSQPS